jgi:hypothetical protein
MLLQPVILGSQNAMNAVDGATIEPRIRIRPHENSRVWDPRKDFFQCMQQSTTPCMRAGVVKQKNESPGGFLAAGYGSYSVTDCDQADHELHNVLTPFGDGRLRTR